MTYIDETPNRDVKVELIETLISVSTGKMYVELERARLTKLLAKIYEDEGKISQAADALSEVQVETYGSMEKEEKTDYLLEQARLSMLKSDFVRAGILSRKINLSVFENSSESWQQLKLRYYDLMISLHSHPGADNEEANRDLKLVECYFAIFGTPIVRAEEEKWQKALVASVCYVLTAWYEKDTANWLQKLLQEKEMRFLPECNRLLQAFSTDEILYFAKEKDSFEKLVKWAALSPTEMLELFSVRLSQHNMRVIAKCYEAVTMSRLCELVQLPLAEAEKVLSEMVVKKSVYARINRPMGIVSFVKPLAPDECLNEWRCDVGALLSAVEKTCHVINREYMIHRVLPDSAK
jgi:26S proteasome regulatory subunit N5